MEKLENNSVPTAQNVFEFNSNIPEELITTAPDATTTNNDLLHSLADEDGMQVPQPAPHPLDPLTLGLDNGSDGGALLDDIPGSNPVEDSETLQRRKRRREAWEQEQDYRRRWELLQKLVDIGTEVELLSQEIARTKTQQRISLPEISAIPHAEQRVLEIANSRRMKDLLQNHCKKALTTMMQHKWSWPFNAAVDTNIYKDYLTMVKTPMDFGSIKQKIDKMQYQHPDGFIQDVRLVFDNARIYNKPGSDVHVMANTLQEKFEEKYASSVAPRVAEAEAIALSEQTEARKRHAGLASAGQESAQEARASKLLQRADNLSLDIVDVKGAAAALCPPVTRAEKEALCAALGRLPQSHFEAAVGLVMHHHPGLQPFDDVAFDLELLDALTLRQMISYVDAYQKAALDSNEGDEVVVNWPGLAVASGVNLPVPKKSASLSVKGGKNHHSHSGGGGKGKSPNIPNGKGGKGGLLSNNNNNEDSPVVIGTEAPVGQSAAPIGLLSTAAQEGLGVEQGKELPPQQQQQQQQQIADSENDNE